MIKTASEIKECLDADNHENSDEQNFLILLSMKLLKKIVKITIKCAFSFNAPWHIYLN